MCYRAQFKHDPNSTDDIFNGEHYRTLQETYITVDGEQTTYKFFSGTRDIAFGLSTDGFSPFRRCKKIAWPLILFNYNLPPEICFHIRNILTLGVIPGPNKPKDFDSFLWPIVEEFLKLSEGVHAFDITTSKLFALHAYLVLAFGDMPAMSMVMQMKGHNGILPCCMCNIKAL
jgi:hypothetical protein